MEQIHGKAVGARARADKLTPEQRSEIARQAAEARWSGNANVLRATHIGELKIGDAVIPCAVLEDGTRVVSERGLIKSFGGKRGGSYWRRKKESADGAYLPPVVTAKNLKPFVDEVLGTAPLSPAVLLSRMKTAPAQLRYSRWRSKSVAPPANCRTRPRNDRATSAAEDPERPIFCSSGCEAAFRRRPHRLHNGAGAALQAGRLHLIPVTESLESGGLYQAPPVTLPSTNSTRPGSCNRMAPVATTTAGLRRPPGRRGSSGLSGPLHENRAAYARDRLIRRQHSVIQNFQIVAHTPATRQVGTAGTISNQRWTRDSFARWG
jgi:hypothetical protein